MTAEGDTPARRLRRFALDGGGLVAVAALVVYVVLAPRWFVDGDNAEFCALGSHGGIAHPSGYPLYVLWLRAWSVLPVSGAHASAIATAVLAAAQLLVLHAACRAWGARPVAASLAVAVYAAAPVVLEFHTEAEVFALNGLIVATVLWLAAEHGPLRGVARAGALGLVAGLGLAHHMTCALAAPVGVLGIVRAVREGGGVRAVAVAAGAFAIGLVPHAYLFVAPDTQASWGHIDSLGGLVDHVLRRDFGGPATLSSKGAAVAPIDNLVALAATVGRSWLYLPALLGVGVLAVRSRRSWDWRMLALAFALAGPVVALRFDKDLHNWVGLFVVRRFHILPVMMLTVPVAVGLDALAARLRAATGTALAVVVLVTAAATSLPRLSAVHSRALEASVDNLLRSLPPGSVVLAAQDPVYFGAAYLQLAGVRPDVVVVHVPMLVLPWYRQRLRARGVPIDERGGIGVDALLKTREVLVDGYQQPARDTFPNYPYGLLFRLRPRGSALPPPDEIFAENRALYDRFDLAYAWPHADDGFAADVHRRYAQAWAELAHLLAAAGSPAAQDAAELAHRLAPAP